MGKTLEEIARQLSTPKLVQRTVPETTKVIEEAKPLPKVQLIYAFNGTGKTRLSREFKELVAPKASPAGAPSTQPIVFTGINSSADFIRLSAQLQRMSVVRGMRPVRATPQGLEIELDLLTGLTGFRRMADAQVLVEADGNIEGVTPVFHLR